MSCIVHSNCNDRYMSNEFVAKIKTVRLSRAMPKYINPGFDCGQALGSVCGQRLCTNDIFHSGHLPLDDGGRRNWDWSGVLAPMLFVSHFGAG